MIDLNWRRQYDIKQKRQRARLATLNRRSPRPSCQSLPISDFGKRGGSTGERVFADVSISVAHGRAFMTGGAPCLVKGSLAPRSPPTIGAIEND
jgi:hypothetical protein